MKQKAKKQSKLSIILFGLLIGWYQLTLLLYLVLIGDISLKSFIGL